MTNADTQILLKILSAIVEAEIGETIDDVEFIQGKFIVRHPITMYRIYYPGKHLKGIAKRLRKQIKIIK